MLQLLLLLKLKMHMLLGQAGATARTTAPCSVHGLSVTKCAQQTEEYG